MSTRLASAVARLLSDSSGALHRGAGEEALELLVAAWGKARLGRLSRAIEALSSRLDVPPIAVGTDQQRAYLTWCERAKARRTVDVGPLVTAFLATEANPKALRALRLGRIKQLAAFVPDPRIDALCDQLERDGWRGALTHSAFERLAKRHVDPERPHPQLAEYAEKHAPPEGLEDALRVQLDALDQAIATASLQRVEAAAPKSPGAESAEAMLAAVYADPGNDALRQVYADRLAERSDPRGELITLQFQRAHGTLSDAGAARERTLLKRHLAEWLGPLATHVVKTAVTFEKGFPATVLTNAKRIFEAKAALALAEWATVREVDFQKLSYFGPSMRSLSVANHVNEFGVRCLLELDALPPLRVLTTSPGPELTRGAPATWSWLPLLRRLVHLEELVVSLPFANHHPVEEVAEALVAHLPPTTWRLGVAQVTLSRADVSTVLGRMPAQLKTVELNRTAWNREGVGWAPELSVGR